MAVIDRTATMTNNTTPSPNVVSASSEAGGTEAFHAFDKNTASGTWQVTAGTTGYLKYDFGASTWAATSYTLLTNGTTGRMPKDWTFSGSNDDSSYTTLDTQTGQSFSAGVANTYSFTNTTKYRYYKINVTATVSASPLEIWEMTIKAPDNTLSGFFFVASG